MRGPRYLISLIAIIAMLCLTGGVAAADDPPGANGTVKVHEYPEHKNGSENANDPKVCRFEIHGNNFDRAQSGRWWIQEHKWGSGDSSKAVAPIGIRSYTANAQGDWTDNHGGAGYTLADGHYKLYVELTHQAGNSNKAVVTYKHKVFKVECPAASGTSGTGTTGGTDTNTNTNTSTNTNSSKDTQMTGETTVRTEMSTVVEGGQQVRIVRIFNNGVLVNEVRTPQGLLGFESAPTGQVIVIMEGVQSSAPSQLAEAQQQPAGILGQQAAPAISQLPSTSTAAGTAGLAIGFAAIAAGLAMLRRRATQA